MATTWMKALHRSGGNSIAVALGRSTDYIENPDKTDDGGWNKKFYSAHESNIIAHKAAKKHFDSLGLKKLPKMHTLKKEYATLDAEKRKLYQGYRPAREEMIALLMAKQNVERILGMTPPPQKSREKSGQEL